MITRPSFALENSDIFEPIYVNPLVQLIIRLWVSKQLPPSIKKSFARHSAQISCKFRQHHMQIWLSTLCSCSIFACFQFFFSFCFIQLRAYKRLRRQARQHGDNCKFSGAFSWASRLTNRNQSTNAAKLLCKL